MSAGGHDPATRRGAVDLARELLARGHPVRYVARGCSMWPGILDGDRLTLIPAVGAVRVGDVMFLPTEDFGLSHRVVARVGRTLCLKGDGCVRPDGWFPAEAFVARVVHIERDGRAVPVRTGLAPAAAAWLQTAVRGAARVAQRVRRGAGGPDQVPAR